MEAFSKYDREEENEWGDPRVMFLYEDSEYEEMQNTIAFDLESFVSGVGGFIGIFLGYSILQVPELMGSLTSLIRKLGQYNKIGNIYKDTRAKLGIYIYIYMIYIYMTFNLSIQSRYFIVSVHGMWINWRRNFDGTFQSTQSF